MGCCGVNRNKTAAGGALKWRVTVPSDAAKTKEFPTQADARAYAVSLGVPTHTKAVNSSEKV